ncbi:MAG: carboxylate--amine ligase [Desulfobacca sp.]|nr:carboxylate--amine ligase [Desulfobacca sp.]
MNVIKIALERGQKALSEYDSKKLLAAYGIPITKEALVKSPEEAVSRAAELGFPVVMKACSPELLHKSDLGGVEIGLKNAAEVREAYERIVGSITVPLEGVLVQEMIRGQRELVLGLSRDPQFGPCVMFGLGGVLTEIINDTVFRVAPLEIIDAQEMLQELRAKAVLDQFRGQAAADRETICRSLIALGRLGLENEAIAEIDINPLIIAPDGQVKAVDALVVLRSL